MKRPSLRWVKASQLATLLRVAPSTVTRWCVAGRWPARKFGRAWFVDLTKLKTSYDAGQVELALHALEQRLAASDD